MTRGQVLIVEDDDEVRELMVMWLATQDVDVRAAGNGAEALRLLQAMPSLPDLILTDLMMPVADGWMLCAELAQHPQLAQIPVAVITAVPSESSIPLAVTPVAVFTKPLDLDWLSQLIREYCGAVR